MRRSPWSHRLVFVVCGVALGLILGGYALYRLREITAHLDRFLVSQLEAQLGRRVASGRVSADRSGRFSIRDLRIAEAGSFGPGDMLTVDRIEGRVDPTALLLHPGNPIGALRRIDLYAPRLVLIHDRAGRWNFADLLRPRGGRAGSFTFHGAARIHGGRLDVQDFRSFLPIRGRPAENRIDAIDASIAESNSRSIDAAARQPGSRGLDFRATGRGVRTIGALLASGRYDVAQQSGTVAARVAGIDLPYWTEYLAPRQRCGSVIAGRATAAATLHLANGAMDLASLDGTLSIGGGAIALAALKVPVRAIRAQVVLHGASASLAAGARLAEIPITLTGGARDLRRPVLDLNADAGPFQVERLPFLVSAIRPERWPSITGPARITARISGPIRSPAIRGRMTSERIVHPRAVAQGVEATVALEHGRLAGTLAVRRALGGTLDARGRYQLDTPVHAWSASGRFEGIDAADLAPPSAPPASGTASGSFTLTGAGARFAGHASAVMASGSVGSFRFRRASGVASTTDGRHWNAHLSADHGSVSGLDFRSMMADAQGDGAGLVIRSARVDAFHGRLTASGAVSRAGALDLRVAARGVRLSEIGTPFHETGTTGTATFSGVVGGTLASPVLAGEIAAIRGTLQGVPYSRVQGHVTAERGSVALRDATIRSGRGSLTAAGSVALRGGRLGALTIAGRVRDLSMEQFARLDLGRGRSILLPPELRSASLSGGFAVSGIYPRLSFDARGLTAWLPEGRASITGTVTPSMTRAALRLDRVPAAVAGIVWNGRPLVALPAPMRRTRITGDLQVSGPFRSIRGTGSMALGPIVIAVTPAAPLIVDEARGHVTVDGSQILLSDVRLDAEGETLTGGGRVSLGGPIDLRFAGTNLRLERLSPFVKSIARVSGVGDAAFTISGRPGSLAVDAHVAAGPLVANSVRFDRFTGEVNWNGGQILLNDLILRRGEDLLRVPSGSYDFRTEHLALDLLALRFSLVSLYELATGSPLLETPAGETARRALAAMPAPLGGNVGGRVHVEGVLGNLMTRVALNGDGLLLRGLTLDHATIDATNSSAGLQVERLALDAPGVHLSASGTLDHSAETQFRARLANSDIQSILGAVRAIPALERTRVGRQIVQTASAFRTPLTGTLDASLDLHGSAGGTEGRLTFDTHGLTLGPQRFDVANGSFALRNRRMYVESLRLEGGEAVITASGSGGFGGDLDLNLNVYNLSAQVVAPWFGLPRNITGVIDVVSVQVTGTQSHPVLQASIDAHSVGTTRFAIDHVRGFGIHADGSRLQVDRIEITEKNPQAGGSDLVTTVSGSLPFSFSPFGVPRTGGIAVHAEVEQQSLAILTALSPEVKAADGTFGGILDLTGTIAHPIASGSLSLQNGSLTLARFRNRFTGLNAVLTLSEHQIALTDFHGASDRGGAFTGSGTVSLDRFPRGAAKIAIRADNLMLIGNNVTGILGEQFTGRLNAAVDVAGTALKPEIGGYLLAHQFALTVPDTPPANPQSPPLLFPVDANFRNFQIIAGDGVDIRRGTFVGQIAGRLAVNGDVDLPHEPYVTGRFLINNGRVHVATKTFRIQDGGTLSISYRPPDPAHVQVDFEATTSITAYSSFDQQGRSYVVTVDLTGSIDNPNLNFRSDPPDLDRQQILAALGYEAQIQAILRGGSNGDRAFRQGVAEAFTGVVAPALFEPLDFAVMRALGLEEFDITLDYNSPLQVQFTKHLMGKFFVTYRRQLTGVSQQYLLKLYYRLTPRINLSYSADDRHTNTWTVEGHLRF